MYLIIVVLYHSSYFYFKMNKIAFIIQFGGEQVTRDDNIIRYVDKDKRMIDMDIRADFEGFVVKTYYHFRIYRSQSHVHIFTSNEWKALGDLR